MMDKLPPSPFLYPILDSHFSKNLVQDVTDVIRAGAKILQLRLKNWDKEAIHKAILELQPLSENNVSIIINDYVDVVMVCDVAGVHLGQEDFPIEQARKLLPEKIIGLSTHNENQFSMAIKQPVDYVAIGPIYASPTKPGGAVRGPSFVKSVRKLTELPLVCVGGIRSSNFQELISAGADGIALISGIYENPDMYESISSLLDVIHKT